MLNKMLGIGRTFLTLFIVALLLLTLDYLFETKVAFYIMAGSFLIMALLFTFKREYFIKYTKLVNPSYIQRLEQKGESFKKGNIITNIVCYYILFITTFINATVQRKNTHLLTAQGYYSVLKFAILVFVLASVSAIINNFILKRSKTNNAYTWYSLLLGGIIAFILIELLIPRLPVFHTING